MFFNPNYQNNYMKLFNKIKNASLLAVTTCLFFTACNKAPLPAVPIEQPLQGTTPTLATLLDDPNFSILKEAAKKAGLLSTLSSPTLRFTIFAPDNAAFTASTAPFPPLAYLASLDTPTVRSIVSYHIVPQVIGSGSIPATFPNFQYPSILNPAPQLSALLRLTTFPSKRSNGAWVNNIPVTATDVPAVNGVLHKVAGVVLPPSRYLWDVNPSTPTSPNNSIFAAPDLTYLKAAISRADSGVAAGSRLVDALTNIGANLTVFAPTDLAFQQALTGAIAQGLIAQGVPAATALAQATFLASTPGVFTNPALWNVITPTFAKGIVAYHILSSQTTPFAPPGIRVFSVNFPTTAITIKTLLNSASVAALHPGVTIRASFTGPFVTSATVKGLANATASNVVINPLNPIATDQHFLNGVIMRIDQVLLPQ